MLEWLSRLWRTPEGAAPYGDPQRLAEADAVLQQLQPLVAADGGRIELLGVDELGVVEVRLHGACASCAVRESTLNDALAPALAARAAWFRGLRAG